MGQMGLKSENEKKGVWKKGDSIDVLYAPNNPALPEKLWTTYSGLNVTHLNPLTRGGASLSPMPLTG